MAYRKGSPSLYSLALTLIIAISPSLSLAELVVIGNQKLGINNITADQARDIWLAKKRRLPGTGNLKVVDQPKGSHARAIFYQKIIKKKPTQLRAHWAKIMFKGEALPPEELEDDSSVLEWVQSHPNGLGYIDSSYVDNTVKVLLTIK